MLSGLLGIFFQPYCSCSWNMFTNIVVQSDHLLSTCCCREKKDATPPQQHIYLVNIALSQAVMMDWKLPPILHRVLQPSWTKKVIGIPWYAITTLILMEYGYKHGSFTMDLILQTKRTEGTFHFTPMTDDPALRPYRNEDSSLSNMVPPSILYHGGNTTRWYQQRAFAPLHKHSTNPCWGFATHYSA